MNPTFEFNVTNLAFASTGSKRIAKFDFQNIFNRILGNKDIPAGVHCLVYRKERLIICSIGCVFKLGTFKDNCKNIDSWRVS